MTTLVERCRPLDRAIGEKLRAARKLRGVTQQQLADHLGVTHQQVQKYEDGANRISASALVLACAFLQAEPLSIIPRLMTGGRPAPDPFAALGAGIGGYELARIYAALNADQQRSVLSVAKAIAGAAAVKKAAA